MPYVIVDFRNLYALTNLFCDTYKFLIDYEHSPVGLVLGVIWLASFRCVRESDPKAMAGSNRFVIMGRKLLGVNCS